ncbi:hypothetical protein M514_02022 [Trichuris suis]|uniref:Uncharacterized protein n=1 Tax=Trichuris suis TaxID=68888 RepID=A0A085N281_9BILA|nr:hypothetical protein M513_02022 [Trichuris suis]KFD63577.1 hypothetical protein M514_24203 [Trichuris suis]KFD63579.1 hypothetical protein M514_02022 [Trichuris suis]
MNRLCSKEGLVTNCAAYPLSSNAPGAERVLYIRKYRRPESQAVNRPNCSADASTMNVQR